MKRLLIVTAMTVVIAIVGLLVPLFLEHKASPLSVDALDTRAVVPGDFDADGDLDLLVVNFGDRNQLFTNKRGKLTPETDSDVGAVAGFGFDAAWGDMDGDGDLDLAVANSRGSDNALFVNRSSRDDDDDDDDDEHGRGSRTLRAVTTGPVVSDGGDSYAAAWGDLDNDGDEDLVFANRSPRNFLYWNDGSGGFTPQDDGPVVTDVGRSRDVVLGDLDGDGDQELLFANSNDQANFLYENLGRGSFVRRAGDAAANERRRSFGMSLADFDADGDLDLMVTNRNGQRNALYRNNGTGVLAAANELAPSQDGGDSFASTWGDVDADGDLDLFVVNRLERNFLYTNNRGAFTRVVKGAAVADDHNSRCATLADFNGDGLPSLVVGNSVGERNVELRNLSKHKAVIALLRPEPAPDGNARGRGTIQSNPYDGRERFSVEASKLSADVTHDLYLEDGAGSGSFQFIASLTPKRGKFVYKVDTRRGDSLPSGATSAIELTGRRLEIRDGATVELLGLASPYGSKAEKLTGHTYMVRPEADLDGRVRGVVSVVSQPYKRKAVERLEVTLHDAPAGTYRLFVETLGEDAAPVEVGALKTKKGKLSLRADLNKGQLPLPGLTSVDQLLNRGVEVRDDAGRTVLCGFVPVSGLSQRTRRALAKLSPVELQGSKYVQVGKPSISHFLGGWASVEIRSIAALGDERFVVQAEKLNQLAGPYEVLLEEAPGNGQMRSVGQLSGSGSRARLSRNTRLGQPLPLGVRFAAELIGRRLEVRNAEGVLFLVGSVPPLDH